MPINRDWLVLESLIRRDPGARGVASYRDGERWLAAGQLEPAARHLAAHAHSVAIVTGFCIADATPPAAETDGPPGALRMAAVLNALGREAILVSDVVGAPLLRAGLGYLGLSEISIVEMPLSTVGAEAIESWLADFWRSDLGARLTHLIAIERVGPSHTMDSLILQRRDGPPPLAEFDKEAPPSHRDVCHNMRGLAIDHVTAPTHRLFEPAPGRPPLVTIGLADGGNEIGMGQIAWEALFRAIGKGPSGQLACRIATDYLLLAGVSNWAGYALAAGLAVVAERPELVAAWSAADERGLLCTLVEQAGAVDGVTRRREATVDGLPLANYLSVYLGVRDWATGHWPLAASDR